MADDGSQGELLSPEMLKYAETALEDAIGFVVAGDDPFIPFVMIWNTKDERSTRACMSEDYTDAIKLGWTIVENERASTTGYALAWSGYYGQGEERRDAIYIETSHIDHHKTVTLAATYQLQNGQYQALDTILRGVQENVLKNKRKDA